MVALLGILFHIGKLLPFEVAWRAQLQGEKNNVSDKEMF